VSDQVQVSFDTNSYFLVQISKNNASPVMDRGWLAGNNTAILTEDHNG
jgi:hypothetical protein